MGNYHSQPDSVAVSAIFLHDSPLLVAEAVMSDEQSLALHHYLHLAQVIAYQCASAADDVEDGICQPDTRTDLH